VAAAGSAASGGSTFVESSSISSSTDSRAMSVTSSSGDLPPSGGAMPGSGNAPDGSLRDAGIVGRTLDGSRLPATTGPGVFSDGEGVFVGRGVLVMTGEGVDVIEMGIGVINGGGVAPAIVLAIMGGGVRAPSDGADA